ncbi:FAD-binding oxidoreductase [Nonomuraea typhae]|uniref:FAD-binding oxidoreductase n=1 Tax=Nonomuraea typhae TaxID=2603600 RepID=A0ABW7YU69_9ACTN
MDEAEAEKASTPHGAWLRDWAERLGDTGAEEIGQANVGMFRQRRVLGTLRPARVAQVREIVASAPPGVALYPVSTGYNWGLGSREPVADGAVVLGLDRLRRVRRLDLDIAVAVIEPGVTQGALAELLAATPYMVNVTASSPHTSIIGNALERGVGLRRQRCEDVAGLEVVLADGRLVRLGNWPDERGRMVPYRHELGPGLMPLFAQSNFGVVTAAVIRLLPRPQALTVIRLTFDASRLARAVDELRRYYGQRLISGVLKIYQPVGDECWAFCCVDGDAELVACARELLMRRAGRSGLFDDIREHAGDDELHEQLQCCLGGDPRLNERVMERWFGAGAPGVDGNPDQGFLFFLPLLPFQGAAVAEARALVREIAAETGTTWTPTVNAISPDVIDLVVSCRFPKGAAAPAHQALDLLYSRFAAAGWRPYRLDVEHMAASGPPDLLKRLKDVFDPLGVIAPARYEPREGPVVDNAARGVCSP